MPKKTILERLEEKFVRSPSEGGCWTWNAAISPGPPGGKWAYGIIVYNGRLQMAHRVSYQVHRGEIPTGAQLDHLCKNTLCVNPWHLEPVTPKENINRGDRFESAKTLCDNGHPLSGDNLYLKKNGWRECKTCRKQKYREWVELNRERRRELDRENHRRKREKG